MKLGDTITLAGSEWKVRPFTPAEHQAWDELAEAADLHGKAVAVQTAQAARAGGARQMLLESRMKAATKRLDAYLVNGELRTDLSEDERVAAFSIAAELDLLADDLNAVKAEPLAHSLTVEEDLVQARESVSIEFMHTVLAPPLTLAEFAAALTPAETVVLDELVVLGKLRAGLSARARRETALLEQYLSRLAGNASESQPPPPVAQGKPGRSGRSKPSSSRSKGGDSAPSKPPPR